MCILFTSNTDLKLDWHHQLHGHEFQQAPEMEKDRKALAYADRSKKFVGHKKLDTTEWLKRSY